MEEFKFLDGIAIADVAIESRGDTLEELFGASATATFEVMVDTKGVKPRTEKVLFLESQEIDTLLFDWLSELIYVKDAEYMVFSSFTVQIQKSANYILRARIFGEKISPARHELRCDVKAVTYHLFEVSQKKGKWISRFVLDI